MEKAQGLAKPFKYVNGEKWQNMGII